MNPKTLLQYLCIAGVMFLVGCSSKYDPASEPSTITLSMVATDTINPNNNGDASPVELKVFELEDDSMFMSASYDQLLDDYKKALKSNYVDDYDYVLLPGQFKFIDQIKLDEDTRYIGVMAFFADPEQSDWKKVVKLKTLGREYHLLVLLNHNDVIMERVE
ncbi:type VI secretion system lipoprotein TssJ [Photobacterium leiognathi]|uniref:type VI secretion system lipoprotein TssJ n=1 Tax=Photobacterium leiognathi TaxID=553611 RepID=UPI00387F6E39